MRQLLVPLAAIAMMAPVVKASVILYGGSAATTINNDWSIIIDQSTGTIKTVGFPAGVTKLSGLALLSNISLWTSGRVLIDLNTGAVIENVGRIAWNSSNLQIADLAYQPGSGTLSGISASAVLANTSTAAILAGATGDVSGGVAVSGSVAVSQTTSSVDALGSLAVSSDDTIPESDGGGGLIDTINLNTPTTNTLGDLAVQPQVVPEPATVGICGLALAGFLILRRARSAR
jgi:hypothetical protein